MCFVYCVSLTLCVSLSLSCVSLCLSHACQLLCLCSFLCVSHMCPVKMIGLFCKRALLKRRYSAKETYNSEDDTAHRMSCISHMCPVCCLSLISCVSPLSCVSLISFVCLSHCCRVACPSYASHMGWLRSVGTLKSQVSFAKEPYKRDYILQKRPIILRSLLIVATPYLLNLALLLSLIYVVSLLSCLLIISISV